MALTIRPLYKNKYLLLNIAKANGIFLYHMFIL